MLRIALAIALVGLSLLAVADPASATGLCKENKEECPAGEPPRYGITNVVAGLKPNTKALFSTDIGDIECSNSVLEFKPTVKFGTPLPANVSEWSFGKCGGVGVGLGCVTQQTFNLPYAGSVSATGTGSGNLSMSSGGNGRPGVWFECVAGSGVFECKLEKPTMVLEVTGGAPAFATAKSIAMEFNKGKRCPKTAALWSAEYQISSPNPLFVSALP